MIYIKVTRISRTLLQTPLKKLTKWSKVSIRSGAVIQW